MNGDLELNKLDKFVQRSSSGSLFFLPIIPAAYAVAIAIGGLVSWIVPLSIFLIGEAVIITLLTKVKSGSDLKSWDAN